MQSISSCIEVIIFFFAHFSVEVSKYHFYVMLGALAVDCF
jgi:hypothetical protein